MPRKLSQGVKTGENSRPTNGENTTPAHMVALHSWLALRYGPFIAHGVVAGSLLLLALILFTLALVRRRPKVAPPPRLQSAQPAALIGTLRQGGYDEVISRLASKLSRWRPPLCVAAIEPHCSACLHSQRW